MAEDRILHFQILEELGRGGMGVVYKAHDTKLDRMVALKFLSPERAEYPEFRQRFEVEAKAAASVDHANVCPVYEFGETHDGRLFIAMAFCEGKPLKEILATSPRSLEDALRIIAQVAAGMAAAHRKGVIHRDLKPGNLILDPHGGVRVLDFGLARLDHGTTVTQGQQTMGTFAYMSPEQASAERSDARSDVYAMGVILYEMVTGKLPFRAETQAGMIHKILHEPPPPLGSIVPDVPPAVEALVERAMAKKPDDRFRDAGAFRAEVKRVRRELFGGVSDDSGTEVLSESEPGPKSEPAPGSGSGHLLRWVGGGLAAVLLVLLALRVPGCSDPPPASVGLAVVALAEEGAAGRTLAIGLADHLARTLGARAPEDSSLWVEPPSWVQDRSPSDRESARVLLGADLLLVLQPGADGDSTRVDLSLEWATGEVLRVATLAPAEGRGPDPAELLAALPGDLAIGDIEEAVPPGEAWLAYLRGRGLVAEGDIVAGLAELERSIGIEPGYAGAHAAVAAARLTLGTAGGDTLEWARAERSAREAMSAGVEAHGVLARLALARGNPDTAIAYLREALEREPGNPELYAELAEAYVAAGQPEAAREALEAGLVRAPGYPALLERLGKYHYHRAEFREAISYYLQAAVRAPGDAVSFVYLGASFYALGCWNEAIAMFERSFAIDRNYFACSNLAALYYFDHRFEEARGMFELTLEFTPEDHESQGGLGATYYWQGDRERARESYENAIATWEAAGITEADEYYPYYLAKLAGYHVMVDSARARALNQEALDRAPDDSSVLYAVAENWEALGEREKALRELAAYLKLRPNDPSIEAEPYFQELVKDPRYALLVRGLDETPADCPRIPAALRGS